MSIKQFMILNLCFLYTNRSLHKIYFVPVKERTRTKLRTNYSGVVRKQDAQCRITKWHLAWAEQNSSNGKQTLTWSIAIFL